MLTPRSSARVEHGSPRVVPRARCRTGSPTRVLAGIRTSGLSVIRRVPTERCFPAGRPVRGVAVVPYYRCGAVPVSHRIPSYLPSPPHEGLTPTSGIWRWEPAQDEVYTPLVAILYATLQVAIKQHTIALCHPSCGGRDGWHDGHTLRERTRPWRSPVHPLPRGSQ